MLVLLKDIGLFFLAFILSMVAVPVIYWFLMLKVVYIWSVRRCTDYLSVHGRGNFADENDYIAGIDILIRIIWVFAVGVVTSFLGIVLLYRSIPMVVGLLLAEAIFMFVASRIEMGSIIRIGRLESFDSESKKAYFVDLRQDAFEFEYGDDECEKFFFSKHKYLVADLFLFKMFNAVDDFEWKEGEWPV